MRPWASSRHRSSPTKSTISLKGAWRRPRTAGAPDCSLSRCVDLPGAGQQQAGPGRQEEDQDAGFRNRRRQVALKRPKVCQRLLTREVRLEAPLECAVRLRNDSEIGLGPKRLGELSAGYLHVEIKN